MNVTSAKSKSNIIVSAPNNNLPTPAQIQSEIEQKGIADLDHLGAYLTDIFLQRQFNNLPNLLSFKKYHRTRMVLCKTCQGDPCRCDTGYENLKSVLKDMDKGREQDRNISWSTRPREDPVFNPSTSGSRNTTPLNAEMEDPLFQDIPPLEQEEYDVGPIVDLGPVPLQDDGSEVEDILDQSRIRFDLDPPHEGDALSQQGEEDREFNLHQEEDPSVILSYLKSRGVLDASEFCLKSPTENHLFAQNILLSHALIRMDKKIDEIASAQLELNKFIISYSDNIESLGHRIMEMSDDLKTTMNNCKSIVDIAKQMQNIVQSVVPAPSQRTQVLPQAMPGKSQISQKPDNKNWFLSQVDKNARIIWADVRGLLARNVLEWAEEGTVKSVLNVLWYQRQDLHEIFKRYTTEPSRICDAQEKFLENPTSSRLRTLWAGILGAMYRAHMSASLTSNRIQVPRDIWDKYTRLSRLEQERDLQQSKKIGPNSSMGRSPGDASTQLGSLIGQFGSISTTDNTSKSASGKETAKFKFAAAFD